MESTNPSQNSNQPPAGPPTQNNKRSPLEQIWDELTPATSVDQQTSENFLQEITDNLSPELQGLLQHVEEVVASHFPNVLDEPDVQGLLNFQTQQLVDASHFAASFELNEQANNTNPRTPPNSPTKKRPATTQQPQHRSPKRRRLN